MGLRAKIPWQAKLAAKLVLSRIPVSYSIWRHRNLFKHGRMELPTYAYKVFKTHLERTSFHRGEGGFVALELGPGDSLLSAMVAHAFGASTSYLIDVGHFAQSNLELYRAMADFLIKEGLPIPEVEGMQSPEELLASYGAHYLTQGLSSLRTIADHSVDFIWSQAVFEHIRRADFLDTMRELRRVIRPDGVCSHRVDLKDHLGGALNNLRFPEYMWESDFMANSGFYTNRIRYSEMLFLFEKAGFNVQVLILDCWDRLPTPRAKLSPAFRHLPDDELCVSGLDVILRPV
jgi:SAM-dependent methyltransferase